MSSPKATDKSQDPARSRKLIRKPQDYSKVLDKNDRSKAIMRGYDIDSDLNESKIDGDREGNDANQDSSDDGDLEVNIDLVVYQVLLELTCFLLPALFIGRGAHRCCSGTGARN